MNAQTVIWGRGPALAPLLASLLDAGICVNELWYEDSASSLPQTVVNEIERGAATIPVIEGVNSSRAVIERLEGLPGITTVCEVFYTRMIRREVFDRIQVINIHPAPLPRYRGAHPLPWQILRGEIQSAVTFHLADGDVDAGPILEQVPFRIEPSDNYGSVLEKVFAAVRLNAGRVFSEFTSGRLAPVAQNHSEASYVVKRAPDDGWIDWTLPSRYIRNFVRALTEPLPGAWSLWNQRKVVLDDVDTDESFARYVGRTPGQVARLAGTLAILTGDSGVIARRVRDAESGREVTGEIRANDRFTSPLQRFSHLAR